MEDVLDRVQTETLQTVIPTSWSAEIKKDAAKNNRSLSAELRMVIGQYMQNRSVSV